MHTTFELSTTEHAKPYRVFVTFLEPSLLLINKTYYSLVTHFFIDDVDPPMITDCPGDQSDNLGVGVAMATVSWTEPSSTDNSGSPTLTSDYNPGDSFPIGTTTVTYTSTDIAGNTATCTFDVVVTSGMF